MNLIYYADSSVLVKRHVQEIGSLWLQNLSTPSTGNIIITATLSIIEVISALNRRKREASISTNDYAQLSTDFLLTVSNEYELIDLSNSVIVESNRLLENYPLRAGDSIQLASAIQARDALQNNKLPTPIFLVSDAKLLDAARAEGFTVDDPLLHP